MLSRESLYDEGKLILEPKTILEIRVRKGHQGVSSKMERFAN